MVWLLRSMLVGGRCSDVSDDVGSSSCDLYVYGCFICCYFCLCLWSIVDELSVWLLVENDGWVHGHDIRMLIALACVVCMVVIVVHLFVNIVLY